MNIVRLRIALIVGLLIAAAVGLITGAIGSDRRFNTDAVFFFAAFGVAHLVAGALLARGVVRPNKWWGLSSMAHLLQGFGWLALALVSARWPWPRYGVGLALGVVPFIVLAIGIRLEHQARARLPSS